MLGACVRQPGVMSESFKPCEHRMGKETDIKNILRQSRAVVSHVCCVYARCTCHASFRTSLYFC